jgi:hypothetical protein
MTDHTAKIITLGLGAFCALALVAAFLLEVTQ